MVAHLVQERGVIETLRDKEIPPGGDYEELKPFLAARIPDAGPNLVDHAVPLVVACGVAIAVAMSFGVAEFQQAQTQVKLAGELVGREGRSPNPEIVKAIKNWPPTRTLKDLQAFLRMANYVRPYMAPLTLRQRPSKAAVEARRALPLARSSFAPSKGRRR